MNSYRLCFAAFPCKTQQSGAAFCAKGSGRSCTNWVRQNDKLSDVAHKELGVFYHHSPDTERERRGVYTLGLFPNPRQSFSLTLVSASWLQLQVAIIGERTPYKHLPIPANKQGYHFLGISWSKHSYLLQEILYIQI